MNTLWCLLGLALAGPDAMLETDAKPEAVIPTLPSVGGIPAPLARVAVEVAQLPLPERIARVSEPLLGLPYQADPLGEGVGVDPDPLARWDVHDCLTFVEQVLGLAMAGDPSDATALALQLRYGSEPYTYVRRRHFMELQWIPGVIADGWMRDSTADYGPVQRLEKVVDASTWAGWRSRAKFAHRDDELPTGTMALDVLSLDDAAAAVGRIRPGSVLLTVRIDRPGVPIWITHVGLTVDAEVPTMRHASRMGRREVRDDALDWYIEHLRSYSNWPVMGIAVLEPLEQGPRRLGAH